MDYPVDIDVSEGSDLSEAMAKAWEAARERMEDPMLVSWYDRDSNRWSPPVECGGKDEPAWLVYAKSRGADLAVSANREKFVFMFRDFAKP